MEHSGFDQNSGLGIDIYETLQSHFPHSDKELTPKPLRVVKRSYSKSSAYLDTDLHYFQPSVIPRRTSSIACLYRKNSSSDDSCDNQSIASTIDSSPPLPADQVTLSIRKQRRSDASQSSEQSVDWSKTARPGEHRYQPRSPTPNRKLQVDRRKRFHTKAVNTFDGLQHTIPNSSDTYPSVAKDPSNPGNHDQEDDMNGRPSLSSRCSYDGVRPRKQSIRQRILEKMGGSVRYKSSESEIAIPDRRNSVSGALPTERISPVQESPSKTPKAGPDGSSTTWSSNVESSSILLTPPKSTFTSGTSISSDGKDLCFLHQPPSAVLSRRCPSSKTVTGARLNIMSELSGLDIATEQSLFVAIDVEGILEVKSMTDTSIVRKDQAIDLAVVIDNSAMTSPAALLRACESVRYISLLLSTSDRLAIYATNDPDAAGIPREILGLVPVNQRRVKTALDSLNSYTKRCSNGTKRALDKAVKALMEASSLSSIPNASANRHVLLLSSPAHQIDSTSSHPQENICFHLIDPGLITKVDRSLNSQWQWRVSAGIPNSQVPSTASLFEEKLGALVQSFKSGSTPGTLTDLRLKLIPGPYCQIHGIMGDTEFTNLCVGETRTVLVSIKANNRPDHPTRLLDFPCSPRTASGAVDLMKELEAIVGDNSRTILTVKLAYTSDLLPENTRCKIKTEASVKEEDARSKCQPLIPAAGQEGSVQVQQRLIRHLAANQSPRHALTTLCDHFGADGSRSVCPDFVQAIIAELKYRARTIDRLDDFRESFDDSASLNDEFWTLSSRHISLITENKLPTPFASPSQPTPRPSYDVSSSPRTVITRYPSSPNVLHTASPSYSTAGSTTRTVSQREGVDQARRIWTELRKTSRGKNWKAQESTAPDSRYGTTMDEWRDLQMLALRNKRSVGTDTLRSLSMGGAAPGHRMAKSAPWL
ncbi:hypothetical protein MMC25_004304 [Agyrium rufum]|nr:hypothetical protein [Agyrium rufum]